MKPKKNAKNVRSFDKNACSFEKNGRSFEKNTHYFQKNVHSFQKSVPSFQKNARSFEKNACPTLSKFKLLRKCGNQVSKTSLVRCCRHSDFFAPTHTPRGKKTSLVNFKHKNYDFSKLYRRHWYRIYVSRQ